MGCPGCPELGVGDWSQELMEGLGGRRYPFGATFEITERCNLTCVHCFINQPMGSRESRGRELTLAEIKTILDQMAEIGCLSLLLTGGEPLLRPDFLDIWRHAKQKGMLVTLFTNGTLLTPRIADVLAEWPPHLMEISLYGDSAETYEQVTQIPGSYARCRRGIELALDRGLRLGLKAVVLTINRHELPAMKAFADRLGVRFRYDAMVWPRFDGNRDPWAYVLSPQEIVALDGADLERQEKWLELQDGLRDGLVRAESVFTCNAGLHGFHIDAAGRMSVCMMARRPAYDLRQGTLQEGWRFLASVREGTRTLETPCRTCTVGILCNQCPGWSQVVHGDKETPVAYVCQVGRLRAERFASPDH